VDKYTPRLIHRTPFLIHLFHLVIVAPLVAVAVAPCYRRCRRTSSSSPCRCPLFDRKRFSVQVQIGRHK